MRDALALTGRALRNWYDALIMMVMLNLVWFALSLSIILLPPATAAMYEITSELAHGRSQGFGEFAAALRQYFVKSWLWALLNILVAAVVWSNLVFYGQWHTVPAQIMQGVVLALTIFWVTIQFYFWPYMTEMTDHRITQALRNAFLTTLAAPLFTFTLVIVSALVMLLSVGMIAPLGLAMTSLLALLGSHAVLDRLEAFGKRGGPGPEDADTP